MTAFIFLWWLQGKIERYTCHSLGKIGVLAPHYDVDIWIRGDASVTIRSREDALWAPSLWRVIQTTSPPSLRSKRLIIPNRVSIGS
jgi:hypothetical protein